MKPQRKFDECLNCGQVLHHYETYCPTCGQKNHEVNIGFGQLVTEFLGNYFALDSRIGRSIFPFVIRPGFLTNKFNEGKRKKYVHPVRLYLAMSIFYFFILSLTVGKFVKTNQTGLHIQTEGLESLDLIDQGAREILLNTLSEESLDSLGRLDNLDQMRAKDAIGLVVTKDEMAELKRVFGQNLEKLSEKLKTKQDTTQRGPAGNSDLVLQLERGAIDFRRLMQIKNDLSLNDQEVVDSVTTGELTSFENKVALQMIKLARSRTEAVLQIIVNNFPVMMLLLIPLFAAILKLLHLGSGRLYIEHIIHGLHLHAFAYFIYGAFLFVLLVIGAEHSAVEEMAVLAFLIVTVYAFISFKRVYQGPLVITLFKFLSVGFVYILTIFFFFIGEVLISLYLF